MEMTILPKQLQTVLDSKAAPQKREPHTLSDANAETWGNEWILTCLFY